MKIEILDGALLKKALAGAAKFLDENKEEVNSLNVFPVPDGDTGTNMSLTVNSAIKQGLSVDTTNVGKIAMATSHGSLMGARGNSGVILSQLFRGFATGLGDREEVDVKVIAQALKQASDTAYKAVMKPTEGTILTVARESAEYGLSIAKSEKDILIFLKKVIEQAEKTLEKTPDLLPVLKQAGVVDAGGKGLVYVLKGAYNALAGIEEVSIESEKPQLTSESFHHRESIDTDNIVYGYCTEFMINTDYNDIDKFRDELALQGDSLLVVGGDGLIKVHIHTNNPGLALEKALKLGDLTDIKIDNMRYQHEEVLLKAELESAKNEKALEDKDYGFIAISAGQGLDDIFKSLNVDTIVSGGQTMNPSTEDILKSIDKTPGKNIFILPNNGNIILAAEQAKNLSERNIIVIPTKTIPQGISTLLAFDESSSVEENVSNMAEAIEDVKTGQITYSVRDTEFNNTKINKDDIIGISEGDIVASGKDINEVSLKLLETMVDKDSSLITIMYGEDISEDYASKLEEKLEEIFDDLDLEIVYGGQPIYYYIFSVE